MDIKTLSCAFNPLLFNKTTENANKINTNNTTAFNSPASASQSASACALSCSFSWVSVSVEWRRARSSVSRTYKGGRK